MQPVHNIFSVRMNNEKENICEEFCCFAIDLVVQNDLGVINDGLVYGLYDYEPTQSFDETLGNELAFKDGDQLKILRRGDENESEWWWAKHQTNQEEGYVPRNYLGVCLHFYSHLSSSSSSLFQLCPRVRPGSMASTSC